MRKFLLIALIVCSVPFLSMGQNTGSTKGKAAVGLGMGLPYGGFGGRFSINPLDQFALFAGFGYNLVGLGYNVGMQYILPSEKRTEVFLTAMYGYNAVIKIQGTDIYNDSYNGLSAGAGLRINSRKKAGMFWDLGVLIPARSQEYRDDWNNLNNNPMIENLTKASPVLVFVGLNFPISGGN
jgi:hypothetical protein